METTHGNL
jgi:hypothetical protein